MAGPIYAGLLETKDKKMEKTRGLLGGMSISPYGEDGWQVPPMVQGLLSSAYSGATLPGDVYAGKASSGDIGRVLDTAGLLTLGSAPIPVPENSLRMFGGVTAKTADHAALKAAQDMAEKGISRDDIWKETGWFKGVDDKWRFEIDDSAANVDLSKLANSETQGVFYKNGSLSDGVDHETLFKAYPDLKGLDTVSYDFPGVGTSAEYRSQFKTDYYTGIPESITTWKGGERKPVVLHEIQHAVQDREGFAQGGNSRSISPAENPSHAKWKGNNDAIDKVRAYTESQEYRKDLASNNTYFENVWAPRLAEIEDKMTGRDEYAKYGPLYDAMMEEASKDLDARFPKMAEADRVSREFGGLKEPSRMLTKDETYRRLAGEAEARNTEKRANMTLEERRAIPPWKTQDVPDEQQIIRFMQALASGNAT